MNFDARFTPRPAALLLVTCGALVCLPARSGAQYFGRNKVQYETFDFRVMHTDHFDVHYYPAESLATADAARMAERWYERLSPTLRHSFARNPLIFYADHPDFQQTNVIGGFISQGTGGVTEGLRKRVVLPFTGVYASNDHVIGHELVHVFQYDIAGVPSGGAGRGLNALPLWLIEGMAEYLSVGRDDPHTAMWLRDATLRDDLPSIKQLTRDPRYFPYRYGQALWAYIGGRWGDDVIPTLYRASLRGGWDPAVKQVLGVSSDTLSNDWREAIRSAYRPVMAGRTLPRDAGDRVLARSGKRGEMDISPSLSPDGRYVAFFSGRGIFSVDLFVADARSGHIIKRLTSPNSDQHFDALSFLSSAGAWSPDGSKLAFAIFAQGDNAIAIFDVASRRVERRISVKSVGEITDPAWGSDGRIVFSGSSGGISDLYLLDLPSERVRRLTSDRHADLQPAWSPDGRTIAFATDRGPGTDFERLTYAPMRLATIDVATGEIRALPAFAGAKHINPQFSPDGREIFFISDRGGFSDIYRLSLDDGALFQVTRLATGVSGITALSPALSVAREGGRLMFSAFDNAGHTMIRLEADRARGEPVAPIAEPFAGAGLLPPTEAIRRSTVSAYLAQAVAGLPPTDDFRITPYRPTLRLDYVGVPSAGVAVTPFGTAVGGAVAVYFGDLLGDRVLGGTIQATGTLKDVGGQVFFLNQKHRWNWLVGASHTPYLSGATAVGDTIVQVNGQQVRAQLIEQFLQRVYVDQVSGGVQYPLSITRRVELSAEYTHLAYDFDVERLIALGDQTQRLPTEDVDAPPGLSYGELAAAFVGDYSIFGFTSPVAGGRYRFEVSPVFGAVTFQTLLADYRRYLFARPVTFAFRGLHYGRYGSDAESDRLSPLFVGQESLLRGYAAESFSVEECTRAIAGRNDCPEFDRLVGSRIGIASVELRIPLLGTEELGLINFSFLPTEIAPFFDAGVAWTESDSPELEFSRRSSARVPVFSAGVSARVNLLGYAIGEAYYAYPFQRPEKGWHFGFQLAPGW